MKKQMGHYAAIARKDKDEITEEDWQDLMEVYEERGEKLPTVVLDRIHERLAEED